MSNSRSTSFERHAVPSTTIANRSATLVLHDDVACDHALDAAARVHEERAFVVDRVRPAAEIAPRRTDRHIAADQARALAPLAHRGVLLRRRLDPIELGRDARGEREAIVAVAGGRAGRRRPGGFGPGLP